MSNAKRRSPDKELTPPAGPALKPFHGAATAKLHVPGSASDFLPRSGGAARAHFASPLRPLSPSLAEDSFTEDFSPQTVLESSLLVGCSPSPCSRSDCECCPPLSAGGLIASSADVASCSPGGNSSPLPGPRHRASRSSSALSASSSGSSEFQEPPRSSTDSNRLHCSPSARPPTRVPRLPRKVPGGRSLDAVPLPFSPSPDNSSDVAPPQMDEASEMVRLRPCDSAPPAAPPAEHMVCDTPRGRRANRGFVLPVAGPEEDSSAGLAFSAGRVSQETQRGPDGEEDAMSVEVTSPRLPVRRSVSLGDDASSRATGRLTTAAGDAGSACSSEEVITGKEERVAGAEAAMDGEGAARSAAMEAGSREGTREGGGGAASLGLLHRRMVGVRSGGSRVSLPSIPSLAEPSGIAAGAGEGPPEGAEQAVGATLRQPEQVPVVQQQPQQLLLRRQHQQHQQQQALPALIPQQAESSRDSGVSLPLPLPLLSAPSFSLNLAGQLQPSTSPAVEGITLPLPLPLQPSSLSFSPSPPPPALPTAISPTKEPTAKPLSPLSGASARSLGFLSIPNKRSNLGFALNAGLDRTRPHSPLSTPPPASPLRARRAENMRLKRKRPPILEIPTKGCFTSSPMNTPPPEVVEEVVEEERGEGEGFAGMCKKGKRERMEDCFGLVPQFGANKTDALFLICDGHSGSAAAKFTASHLPTNLLTSLHRPSPPDGPSALRQAFLDTDAQFLGTGKPGGSCVACCWLSPASLTVAHVGDCRVVLSRAGQAQALTWDHKASREDERSRVEALGGHVDCFRGGVWRVNGMLAVTRAIGDAHLKEVVTAEPEVTRLPLTGDCEFLIMATDGLWDTVTSQEAVDVVRECLGPVLAEVVSPPSGGGSVSSPSEGFSAGSSTGAVSSSKPGGSSSLEASSGAVSSSSSVVLRTGASATGLTASRSAGFSSSNSAATTDSPAPTAAAGAAAAAGISGGSSVRGFLNNPAPPASALAPAAAASGPLGAPPALHPMRSPSSLATRRLWRHNSERKPTLNDFPLPTDGDTTMAVLDDRGVPATPRGGVRGGFSRDLGALLTPRFSPGRGFNLTPRGGSASSMCSTPREGPFMPTPERRIDRFPSFSLSGAAAVGGYQAGAAVPGLMPAGVLAAGCTEAAIGTASPPLSHNLSAPTPSGAAKARPFALPPAPAVAPEEAMGEEGGQRGGSVPPSFEQQQQQQQQQSQRPQQQQQQQQQRPAVDLAGGEGVRERSQHMQQLLREACSRLVQKAVAAGSNDDVGVIVVALDRFKAP